MMEKRQGKVLIVDDDPYVLLSIKLLLEQEYQTVVTLPDPGKLNDHFKLSPADVVLLDLNFKPGDISGSEGISCLKKIRQWSPETAVIIMTAYGEVNLAVQAMKEGAMDFVVKPWQNEKLMASVHTAWSLNYEKQTVKQLQSKNKAIVSSTDRRDVMIGESPAMKEMVKTIEKVAATDANILILGDNGTGKEVVARAIHRSSQRAGEVFISIDLGSLSESLFESELFGHKKGAFTDAREDRIGRMEAAAGGTLFLDEIGNLSLAQQVKLLTVLQNRKITRLGTNHPTDIDVRVICATNQNLGKMVKEGKFREDLLYRVNTVEIKLPALKDRSEDIPLLVRHYLNFYSRKYLKPDLDIPEYVITKLQKYAWPGNIRELQHSIERAVILCEGETLLSQDFSFLGREDEERDNPENYNLEQLEAWAIKNAIRKHKGNISHAALELGLSRGALYRRMEKYDL